MRQTPRAAEQLESTSKSTLKQLDESTSKSTHKQLESTVKSMHKQLAGVRAQCTRVDTFERISEIPRDSHGFCQAPLSLDSSSRMFRVRVHQTGILLESKYRGLTGSPVPIQPDDERQ